MTDYPPLRDQFAAIPQVLGTLAKRILVGMVLAVLAFGAVWLGGWSFRSLLLFVGLIVVLEFTAVTRARDWWPARPIACLAFLGVWLAASLGHAMLAVLIGDIIALALVLVSVALRHRPAFWTALSLVYAGAAVVALIWLRDGAAGRDIVAWLILVVMVTDTAAFFAGRAIGGPKLAPSISPNKTWAGLAGGMLAAALAGAAFAYFLDYQIAGISVLSVVVAVFAQLGDLVESQIKRSFGVKDSGSLLPGHGGFMDRVDGYLLAAPLVALAMLPMSLGG